MKRPLEIDDKTYSSDAEILRRQYFQFDDRPDNKQTEKNESLLTPFLLSIPVIIMLIILIYSL